MGSTTKVACKLLGEALRSKEPSEARAETMRIFAKQKPNCEFNPYWSKKRPMWAFFCILIGTRILGFDHKSCLHAKIGGGGLTAARYDVSEKQLSETKKQSKILKQIAKNTEPNKNKIELLMK